MFTGISWYGYLVFMVITTALYYLALLIIYGKSAMNKLRVFSRSHKRTWHPQEAAVADPTPLHEVEAAPFEADDEMGSENKAVSNTTGKADDKDRYFPMVHDLVDEIQAFLQASGKDAEKDELLQSLKRLLRKYAMLKHTSFRKDINKLITTTCENKCSIHISDEDVSDLWE